AHAERRWSRRAGDRAYRADRNDLRAQRRRRESRAERVYVTKGHGQRRQRPTTDCASHRQGRAALKGVCGRKSEKEILSPGRKGAKEESGNLTIQILNSSWRLGVFARD